MNVFGTTTDGERRKTLSGIEETNEILAYNLDKFKYLVEKQEVNIKTLFNNEADIRVQLQDIISL
jgi:hypothetical protein